MIVIVAGAAGFAVFRLTRDGVGASSDARGATSGQATSIPARTQVTANQAAESAGCPADPHQQANSLQFSAPGQVLMPATLYAATVKTTIGTFRIALNQGEAPQTVNSFLFLAQAGYFNCNAFEPVVPGELDQTGDPTGSGSGKPGYSIPVERPPVSAHPGHQYGIGDVLLANGGAYDAGGSQWFVVTGPRGEALPDNYTVFGKIISGLDVVQKINQEGSPSGEPAIFERILSVSIQIKHV